LIQAAVCKSLTAIFVSLGLSQLQWLITLLAVEDGEQPSKLKARGQPSYALQRKAEACIFIHYAFVIIWEVGLAAPGFTGRGHRAKAMIVPRHVVQARCGHNDLLLSWFDRAAMIGNVMA
jgi:hypothetical protein